jgi:hypothetical protein
MNVSVEYVIYFCVDVKGFYPSSFFRLSISAFCRLGVADQGNDWLS